MKIPQLRKQPEKKSCHGYSWVDEYSWIHQNNCLEILTDTSKLNPEVRKYLDEENAYTKENMKDTENLQKKLFNEIESEVSGVIKEILIEDSTPVEYGEAIISVEIND